LEDQTLEFGVKYWWIYDFSGTNGFKWP